MEVRLRKRTFRQGAKQGEGHVESLVGRTLGKYDDFALWPIFID